MRKSNENRRILARRINKYTGLIALLLSFIGGNVVNAGDTFSLKKLESTNEIIELIKNEDPVFAEIIENVKFLIVVSTEGEIFPFASSNVQIEIQKEYILEPDRLLLPVRTPPGAKRDGPFIGTDWNSAVMVTSKSDPTIVICNGYLGDRKCDQAE